MKNLNLKALFVLIISFLLLSTTNAANQFTSQEEFERAEGAICESATDGCNTFVVTDGKINAGTLKLCTDYTPVWECTKYKEGGKTYLTIGEFEEAEGKVCKNATDGCNTFVMDEFGKVGAGTLKACIGFEKEIWSCAEYKTAEELLAEEEEVAPIYTTKEAFEEAEGAICKNATDGCNSYMIGEDGKVGPGTQMYCENIYGEEGKEAWRCTNYKTADELDIEVIDSTTKTYLNLGDFEKAEGLTCTSASDGCNTFFMTRDGKVGAGTLKACEGVTEEWTCLARDPMMSVLTGTDAAEYLEIKAGGLSPEVMTAVEHVMQKYLDKMSKMSNEVRVNNLTTLAEKSDEIVVTLSDERYSRALEIKINVVKYLKYLALKEISVLETAIANTPEESEEIEEVVALPELEYFCDNQQKMFLTINGDELTLNDNFTKRFYTLTKVALTNPSEDTSGLLTGAYADETNNIVLNGEDATFERNGVPFYTNCKLQD